MAGLLLALSAILYLPECLSQGLLMENTTIALSTTTLPPDPGAVMFIVIPVSILLGKSWSLGIQNEMKIDCSTALTSRLTRIL